MKESTTIKSKYLHNILLFSFLLACSFTCNAKSSLNVLSRPKPPVETPSEYTFKYVTSYLSKEFNKISDEELGLTVIKELYSKLKYTKALQELDKFVVKIANNLESKLNESILLLIKARDKIESFAKFHPFVQSAGTLCDDGLYGQFEVVTVNPNNSYSELPLSTNQVLRKQLDSVKKLKGAIKQLYLLSKWDVISNTQNAVYNCKNRDESLLWKSYVLKNTDSTPRNVMLLLDHGGSLSKHQFHIVKAVAKHMISVLNRNDRVGVLGISDEWSYPYITEQCLMPNQIPPASDSHVLSAATEHNKYLLNRFIDSLTKGNDNTKGLWDTFKHISNPNKSSQKIIAKIISDNGEVFENSNGIVNCLNEFYANIGQKLN